MDFGLARMAGEPSNGDGTPDFMAPEQIARKAVTHQCLTLPPGASDSPLRAQR